MVSPGRIIWTSDRDFNKDEIRDQRYFLVAEHNDLITKARQRALKSIIPLSGD
jgi:hypothetical protein